MQTFHISKMMGGAPRPWQLWYIVQQWNKCWASHCRFQRLNFTTGYTFSPPKYFFPNLWSTYSLEFLQNWMTVGRFFMLYNGWNYNGKGITQMVKLYLKCVSRSVVSSLWDPMDCIPPDSSVHGVLQARILEWVAIPLSRDLPDLGIEPGSPAVRMDSLLSWVTREAQVVLRMKPRLSTNVMHDSSLLTPTSFLHRSSPLCSPGHILLVLFSSWNTNACLRRCYCTGYSFCLKCWPLTLPWLALSQALALCSSRLFKKHSLRRMDKEAVVHIHHGILLSH